MKQRHQRLINQVIKKTTHLLHQPSIKTTTAASQYRTNTIYFITGCIVASTVVYTYLQSQHDQPLVYIPPQPSNLPSSPSTATPVPTDTRALPHNDYPYFVQLLLQYSIPQQPLATAVNGSDSNQLHNVIIRNDYIAKYNTHTHNPDWCGEIITKYNIDHHVNNKYNSNDSSDSEVEPNNTDDGSNNVGVIVRRDKSDFHISSDLPILFQSTLSQYNRSGYDRGHMVPAGNIKTSQSSMNETFELINISPQLPAFNRGYMSLVESYIRHIVRKSNIQHIVCYTGTLYIPNKPSDNNNNNNNDVYEMRYNVVGSSNGLHVPTHYYKVLLVKTNTNEYYINSFIFPNTNISLNTPLQQFSVPLEQIELYSGYVFFDKFYNQRISKYFTVRNTTQLYKLYDNSSTGRLLHTTHHYYNNIQPLCNDHACMYWDSFATNRIQKYHKHKI